MKSSHDKITVGLVTLPYSQISAGWITPDRRIIKNPIAAQNHAEKLNIQQSNKWEQYEKDFLMLVAGEMSIGKIAEKLERTPADIRNMGKRIGAKFR
ncbi:DUF1317 family protein [Budviciaceae bacterium CWB-B4]|uniref:DUF1317 family protein n=1 Tax=Limnobaculum xujianqingii TaxID=2738837 RepID=A0A9D7ALL7_9GAMM|nr:DUF1317 family protein [Limnobaculum xujianqingii]MBK5075190.1 DUF1317 family protein [Limnobaculum xujianqingii]MBK5178499.1 DUF1317 family protein [Limnobaculum xujianqingii]